MSEKDKGTGGAQSLRPTASPLGSRQDRPKTQDVEAGPPLGDRIRAWVSNLKLPAIFGGGEQRPDTRTRTEARAVGTESDLGARIKAKLPMVFLVLLALCVVGLPMVVRLIQAGNPNLPAWFLSEVTQINFRPAPTTWGVMTSNLGFFLPWIVWMLNIPLLLWQLRKERGSANEMNDWWLVLTAAVLFWFVRNNPLPFGAIGGSFFAWWGGNTPIIWRPEETIPFFAFICAGMGLYASLRGVKDWTPFSAICVLIAVIWKAYDQTSDASWARLFVFVGVLTGVLEIIREPGRRQSDRAGAFGLVVAMLVVFVVTRSIVLYTINTNIELITNPPSWFVSPGKFLYGNAQVLSLLIAMGVAWSARFVAGRVIFGLLRRMAPDRSEFTRLTPQQEGIKFWDTTILSQYAVLAIWLFVGGL